MQHWIKLAYRRSNRSSVNNACSVFTCKLKGLTARGLLITQYFNLLVIVLLIHTRIQRRNYQVSSIRSLCDTCVAGVAPRLGMNSLIPVYMYHTKMSRTSEPPLNVNNTSLEPNVYHFIFIKFSSVWFSFIAWRAICSKLTVVFFPQLTTEVS